MEALRIALIQANPIVGDLGGNAELAIKGIKAADKAGAEIVALPELVLTGYPPEDLLLKPGFIADNLRALDRVVRAVPKGLVAIVGFVHRQDDLYNAAAVISEGKVVHVYKKMYLPNYGVFDEFRYFQAGKEAPVYHLGGLGESDNKGVVFGINICEDIWYPEGPSRTQSLRGAGLIININASPYTVGKYDARLRMLATRAEDNAVAVAYLNMVGGQDEIVFDGRSVVLDERGNLIGRARAFEEDMLIADLDLEALNMRRLHDPRRRQNALSEAESGMHITVPGGRRKSKARKTSKATIAPCPVCQEEEVYQALCLGLADYMRKNGFAKGGIIGLSGGVDSALVAAIASDALGPKNVRGVFMPSRYTSRESREDAEALADALGIKMSEISIEPVFEGFIGSLAGQFKGLKQDTTEENLQARVRGTLLMALSNKTGAIVLTTGNKSEMSVGYATLYGDMAGGFGVIKDVPKTLVYRLAEWRNRQRPVIPERVLTKAPTAELRPGQKDTDSLPPYEMLDRILKAYVEDELGPASIVEELGYSEKVVREVIGMVDRSEYKRRQSPPGIKITSRAFGKDWRVPITNRYKPLK